MKHFRIKYKVQKVNFAPMFTVCQLCLLARYQNCEVLLIAQPFKVHLNVVKGSDFWTLVKINKVVKQSSWNDLIQSKGSRVSINTHFPTKM